MAVLLLIIVATFVVSLISIIGITTLSLKDKILNELIVFFVSLSAGALMGGAFLHLIPEAVEKFSNYLIFIYVLVGFFLFFLIEKILHWHHCHDKRCKVHSFAYMNLFGDGVHNFIDGLVIAASFMASIPLGIATSFAVALHEIPQEIGDFGVLVYAGFSKGKALFYNFISALTAILGGIFGFYLSATMSSAIEFLLPFTAGGFIYIAASDLVPELRKETNILKSIVIFSVFAIGIAIMFAVKLFA